MYGACHIINRFTTAWVRVSSSYSWSQTDHFATLYRSTNNNTLTQQHRSTAAACQINYTFKETAYLHVFEAHWSRCADVTANVTAKVTVKVTVNETVKVTVKVSVYSALTHGSRIAWARKL